MASETAGRSAAAPMAGACWILSRKSHPNRTFSQSLLLEYLDGERIFW